MVSQGRTMNTVANAGRFVRTQRHCDIVGDVRCGQCIVTVKRVAARDNHHGGETASAWTAEAATFT
jgi:hypothetical protein